MKSSSINNFLQSELKRKGLREVTAIEAAQWLDKAGILKDSTSRPGLPLRDKLRKGEIDGGNQDASKRWTIRVI